MEARPTRLVIIIISYNTRSLLAECLRSVHEDLTPDCTVVVLDNGSSDGSPEMISTQFPWVSLVRSAHNLGFARGNNVAQQAVGNAQYFLYLNSDVVLPKGVITQLLDYMDKNADVGAGAPALRLPNGRWQTGGAGFGPSAKSAGVYFLGGSLLLPSLPSLFVNQGWYARRGQPAMVDWVAGACMVVKSEVLADVGAWDESYFMYGEDAEWCLRMRRGGWRIAYLPQLAVLHYHGASSAKGSPPDPRWIEALLRLISTSGSVVETETFRVFAATGLVLRWAIYWAAHQLTGHQSHKANARRMWAYAGAAIRWRREPLRTNPVP